MSQTLTLKAAHFTYPRTSSDYDSIREIDTKESNPPAPILYLKNEETESGLPPDSVSFIK